LLMPPKRDRKRPKEKIRTSPEKIRKLNTEGGSLVKRPREWPRKGRRLMVTERKDRR